MLLIERDLRGEFSQDRFCHQFVLGGEFADRLTGWQRVRIDDSLKLTAHPELAVDQVSDGTRSITIIGHILDPRSPQADNVSIGRALLNQFSTVECLIAATKACGGRWIIVALGAGQKVLFNDALGLRQVFYTSDASTNGFWAGSQPGILAWLFDLRIDAEAERFIDSFETRSHLEYRWPGTATAFREIVHLLPNHCLDLCAGTCHRYWPYRPLQEVGFDESIEKAVSILTGLMRAARHRFDFIIGMTAGIDSRIVLAACREIKAGIAGITVRQGRMPDHHQDLRVAARVLGKVAVPHQIIKALPYMSADFSRAFKENVFLAHDHYGADAEAIFNRFRRSKVVVSGSGAEVVREPFRKRIDASKGSFTATELAGLQWMGESEFAVNSFNLWLDGIDDLHNLHLLDLFSWEQSHGNWLAATQMEFDLAWRDIFTPFNCRDFLETMLAMEERHRQSPEHRGFNALIQKMWPELLDEPINPDNNQRGGNLRKAGQRVKSAIKNRFSRRGTTRR